jgi:glycosyltransferase involved in cell wall biosynthesis
MKILVSSMTFAPDHSGISLYATDFATWAAEAGHEVTVVTGFSWYPKWAKRSEDRRKLFRTDYYKKIKVLRGYLYVPKKVSTLSRVLQEISFILFAFFNFLRAGKQDMIVLFTTPINLGLVGAIFQKLWGAKLIINVQDLQLDAAKSLGMIDKLPITDMMRRIETFSYNQADLVTSISMGMTDIIRQKGIDEDKIYLWPNWIDVPKAINNGVEGEFRKKFAPYANKTIIGYAGNVGIKQGLSVLIDLSERFKDRDDIIFLIIGEGGDLINCSVFVAGAVVQWLRDGLGFFKSSSEIEALANSVLDAGDVFIVPAFTGLGAPHWDPQARGSIFGLTRGTTRAHIARAALESIAFQSADILEAMQKDAGKTLKELRVDGGATANDLLMQFQADLLGVPVVRPKVLETTALGAAYLAGLTVNLWKSREEIAAQWQVEKRFEPRMEAARRSEMMARWREAVGRSLKWAQEN